MVTAPTAVNVLTPSSVTAFQLYWAGIPIDGVLGIGPNNGYPGTSTVITALPGTLNQGALLTGSVNELTFGPNSQSGVSVDGAPVATLLVSFNDGPKIAVSGAHRLRFQQWVRRFVGVHRPDAEWTRARRNQDFRSIAPTRRCFIRTRRRPATGRRSSRKFVQHRLHAVRIGAHLHRASLSGFRDDGFQHLTLSIWHPPSVPEQVSGLIAADDHAVVLIDHSKVFPGRRRDFRLIPERCEGWRKPRALGGPVRSQAPDPGFEEIRPLVRERVR